MTLEDIKMSMIVQCIIVIFASLTVFTGRGTALIYEGKVTNRDCDLILSCNFRQVPVISEVDCALFSASLDAIGFYNSFNTGMCNICESGSFATSFTKINIDLDNPSVSKSNSTVIQHKQNRHKIAAIFSCMSSFVFWFQNSTKWVIEDPIRNKVSLV